MLPYSMESADKQMVVGDPQHSILARHLDTLGNGAGSKDMSAAANTFFIQPPANTIFVIDQVRWMISDDAAINSTLFGGISALTNGCLVRVERQEGTSPASVLLDFTDGLPIKTNADLARYGSVEMIDNAAGSLILAGWNLRELAAPIRLDGDLNERFIVQTQDNLTTIAEMTVTVTGRTYRGLAR